MVISAVSVRWVDLGTRLILRHVIRTIEGEEEDGRSQQENEVEAKTPQDGQEDRGDDVDHSGSGPRERTRVATAEVDLNEVRWAECTGREKERKPSRSSVQKLTGKAPVFVSLFLLAWTIASR